MAQRTTDIESPTPQPKPGEVAGGLLGGLDAELVQVAVRMAAYFSVFIVITLIAVPAGARIAIQEYTAIVSAALIGAGGIEVTRQGTLLLLPGITLAVDWSCTAVTILGLYGSLILAYRAPLATRLLGVSVGTVVILAANQLRILGTAFAARYWPTVLHVAHDYLFQVSMVVVAVALWLWWLSVVARQEGDRG